MEAALPGLGLEELYDTAKYPRMYHPPLFEAANGLAEALITGRKKMLTSHFMREQTYDPTGPGGKALKEYAYRLAAQGALSGGIGYFRAHWTDAEHNQQNAQTKLLMSLKPLGKAVCGVMIEK